MTYILHLPHSSTVIPDQTGFVVSRIQSQINLLTDWATDQIYNVSSADKVVANFSRVFCDPERLPDDQEPMYQKGMGICYTLTDDLRPLRRLTSKQKQSIIDNYYLPHHQKLTDLTQKSLALSNHAVIIDCHSFSSSPLKREFNQSPNRPEICLGTDDFHTPPALVSRFRSFFERHGFSVAINLPYSGTVIPLKYYQKDKRVTGIMIEINKKLYMDEQTYVCNQQKVKHLNLLIRQLLS